jgi:GNAT superfamily N-acetyltransferase
MLAYRGGQVAGWLGFSPKSLVPRLQHSRTLPVGDPESWPTTWSVMCFLVRVGFRRQGVARALLDGAVAYAAAHGARRIEGYPVDGGGRRVPVSAAYVGTVDLFEAAGFELVEPTAATSGRLPRWLMVLHPDPVTGAAGTGTGAGTDAGRADPKPAS